jgi:Lar family restriction alleviation protein
VTARELRPCPFCANDKPVVVQSEQELADIVVVVCHECGAVGPHATAEDPAGHAEFLWNQRFGMSQ